MNKTKRLLKRIITTILLIPVILFIGMYIYSLNYYRADENVDELITNSKNSAENNITVLSPTSDNDKNIGLIFYPGGKVEANAYLPLLNEITNKGITCFLVEMPFNLAVFNANEATSIIKDNPNFKTWYLMGHSLGGAMASAYSEENFEYLEGLILLASYPLNNAVDNTISIYGSEDLVLDQSKLDHVENKIIIDGGNHAYFGNYGEQKGDGIAKISRKEQQNLTASIITDYIFK